MPGVVATGRSSASTPSLRSREGSVTPIGRMDAPGGNVRVVVRVRGFLPRGMKTIESNGYSLTSCRGRTRRRMPNSDEPGDPGNKSSCAK
jgi:hypothetical protein